MSHAAQRSRWLIGRGRRPTSASPWLAVLACSSVFWTCSSPDVAQEAETLAVARTALGPITAADVDAFVLAQPPAQRWNPEADPDSWFATLIRRMAVDRLLLDEAKLTGAHLDEEFARLERNTLRQVYTDAFLVERARGVPPLRKEDLRAFFDQHSDRFARAERREVSHIFKRWGARDRQAVRAELRSLRDRSVAGEHFGKLAAEYSDSETRHNEGRLGLVPRGHFPPGFDDIVFELEPDSPSNVINTADGAHLFRVTAVLEGHEAEFETVQGIIAQELEIERRSALFTSSTEDLEWPEPRRAPNPRQLAELLPAAEDAAVLLRLGEYTLRLGQFRERLQSVRQQLGRRQQSDLAWRLLDEIRHREVIYQHLLATSLPEVSQEQIDAVQDRQLVDYYLRRKMARFLEDEPEKLKRYYEDNRLRFATPLKVHLQVLVLPVGADPAARMARLEAARSDLDSGKTGFASLAQELDGNVRDFGFVNKAQVRKLDRRALRFAFLLQPGEHSPPFASLRTLSMLRVEGRQEATPRPFALAREQVVQDYLRHHSPAVFRALADRLLEEAGFEIYPDQLANLHTLGVP